MKPKRILFNYRKEKNVILPKKKPFFIKSKISEKNEILPRKNRNLNYKKKRYCKRKAKSPKIKILEKKKEPKIIKTVENDNKIFYFLKKSQFHINRWCKKESEQSQILSKRDYAIAKEVLSLIKQKNGNLL